MVAEKDDQSNAVLRKSIWNAKQNNSLPCTRVATDASRKTEEREQVRALCNWHLSWNFGIHLFFRFVHKISVTDRTVGKWKSRMHALHPGFQFHFHCSRLHQQPENRRFVPYCSLFWHGIRNQKNGAHFILVSLLFVHCRKSPRPLKIAVESPLRLFAMFSCLILHGPY